MRADGYLFLLDRETGKPLPQEPLFWLKAPTSLIPDGAKIEPKIEALFNILKLGEADREKETSLRWQAGFDLAFQYADQPLKPAALYLLPCVGGNTAIPRRRWLELLERVQQGTPAAQYYQQWVLDKGLKTLEAPKQ